MAEEKKEMVVKAEPEVKSKDTGPILEKKSPHMAIWTLKNFSKVNARKCPRTIDFEGYHWQILVHPKGEDSDGNLSMYLAIVDPASLPHGWSCYAQCSLSVLNQITNRRTITREARHMFNSNQSCWGFKSFMPLADLSANGYLLDDKIIISASVQRVEHDSKRVDSFVGLENPDSTCFMNSVLQSLYHIPCFREAVYAQNDVSPKSVISSLQSLFHTLQDSTSPAEKRDFVESFDLPKRKHGDAHEFQIRLFQNLEETNLKGTMHKLFRGHSTTYISYSCGGNSTKKEGFSVLQLQVKGCSSVYASFDKMMCPDKHDCKDITSHVLFNDFPSVLVLQLMRFEHDVKGSKLNDRYEFPLQLDLDRENRKYFVAEADRNVCNCYSLHSIVVHTGDVHRGHYYAFIRPRLSNQWYKFDDDVVTEVDESILTEKYASEGESANAYMLYYVRKSEKEKIMCTDGEKNIVEHKREAEVHEATKLKPSLENFDLLKSALENFELWEKKFHEEKGRRERAESELAEFQVDRKKLEGELTSWKSMVESIPGASCADDVARKFVALHSELASSVAKVDELQAQIKQMEAAEREKTKAEREAAVAKEAAESEIKRIGLELASL